MWKAILSEPLRGAAFDVAAQVAERLRDPEQVVAIAAVATQQSNLEFKREWTPYSTAYGHAGVALLFGQLDRCFPDRGWDRVAHAYLVPAGRSIETIPASHAYPGLIGGLAGLCFTTHYLSRGGARYQRMISTLDELLVQRTLQTARLPDQFDGVSFGDYDAISGPSGIGAYLLLRRDVPGAGAALERILERLIFLSEWQDGHLRLFIPPERQPTPRHLEQSPHGSTDCGLAHGVPGPLAFLALAHLAGVERPGLPQAIRRLADWVAAQRYEDGWGINWPTVVTPDGDERSARLTKAAWCYGSPGVARALWLAGRALNDAELRNLAVDALRAVRRRPIEERGLPGPIICHGVAGLLQIVLRFANDTGQPLLAEMAEELTGELLDMFDPEAPAGFRDIELEGQRVDNPGLLNGAAGVALALLAAATDAEPHWDRMFLLS